MKSLNIFDSFSGNQGHIAQKHKVTLSIRKDLIQMCKDKGINISASTEQFLKVLTSEYRASTKLEIYQGYMSLFKAIWPALSHHKICLRVGEAQIISDKGKVIDQIFYLSGEMKPPFLYNGILAGWSYDIANTDVKTQLDNLYSPHRVIKNLIKVLMEHHRKDKQKTQDLEISLRFAKMLLSSETDDDLIETGSSQDLLAE